MYYSGDGKNIYTSLSESIDDSQLVAFSNFHSTFPSFWIELWISKEHIAP